MSDFRISDNPEDDLPRRSKTLDRKRPQIEKDAYAAREKVEKPKDSDSVDKWYQYGKSKGEAFLNALDEGYGKVPSAYTPNWKDPEKGQRSEAAKRLRKDRDY